MYYLHRDDAPRLLDAALRGITHLSFFLSRLLSLSPVPPDVDDAVNLSASRYPLGPPVYHSGHFRQSRPFGSLASFSKNRRGRPTARQTRSADASSINCTISSDQRESDGAFIHSCTDIFEIYSKYRRRQREREKEIARISRTQTLLCWSHVGRH